MAIAVTVVETNPNRLRLLVTEDNANAGPLAVPITSAVLRAAIAAATGPTGMLGVPGSRLKELLDTPVVSDPQAERILCGVNIPAAAPNITNVIRAHSHVTPRTGIGQWNVAAVNSAGFPGLSLKTPGGLASAYLDITLGHSYSDLQA